MNTQRHRKRLAIAIGAALFGLLTLPMLGQYLHTSAFDVVGAAQAEEGGKGQGGESGHMGAGGSGGGETGHGGASKGLEGNVLTDKGQRGVPGGSAGGGAGGVKMGRLNMAKAYLSPGFDPTRIDDPEAPLAQIALYKDIVTGDYDEVAKDAAGTALGTAATVNPVTLAVVKELNSLLGITTTWSDEQLTLVAEKATEVLMARRTEETETK